MKTQKYNSQTMNEISPKISFKAAYLRWTFVIMATIVSYTLLALFIYKIYTPDICAPFIEEAQNTYQYPNLKFMVLDFNHPEMLEGIQFDYIVGNGILHHLYNQLDEALLNMKKLLKPQGKIIFMEPNLCNPYCFLIFNTTQRMRQWAKLEPEEMALRKGKIKRQLQKANFVNINIEYKDFLLPNTPSWLIKPIIFTGRILEKIPVLNMLAQSVFITSKYGLCNQ